MNSNKGQSFKASRGPAVKALSIRQPYAWLIVHGFKTLENRPWRTHYRGRILIHAAKAKAKDFDKVSAHVLENLGIEIPLQLPRGGIVGEVEIVDCISQSKSEWFCGPFAFVLEKPKVLPFHPCRGRLSFFNVE